MTLEYVRQVVLATWQAPSAQEADRRVRICVRRQAVIQPRDPHPGLTLKAGISPVSAGSFSVLESRATGAPDVVYLGLDQACRRVVSTGLKGKGLTLPGFATPTQPSGKGLCGEEDIA